MELKKMSYYVVEVSFNDNNPIHRAICFHRSDGNIELSGSYEKTIRTQIKLLSFFRPIEEISALNCMKYPNKFKLPNEAVEKK